MQIIDMDSQMIESDPQVCVKNDPVESNTNGVEQAIYDVLGCNDQELARRQFVNDDNDEESDTDEQETSHLGKKERMISNFDRRNGDETNGNRSGDEDESAMKIVGDDIKYIEHSRPVDGNCQSNISSSMNDYQSEYDYSSSNNMNEADQSKKSTDEPEQLRKLFIGGLDYKTSEETLKQHFEKFGDVNDCVVMREPQSKRSRGFGFVIYANSSMVDKAQLARPHEVDGREVQSKRAISREDSVKPEAQATVKKVYLGGLSHDIEESELRDYFKDFGNIVSINIVAHKDTGKKRGFAFVEYDDYDPVDKIVLKKFHTIRDKRIEAKKAIPKVEMDARKRGDPRSSMAGAMMALTSGPPIDGSSGRSRQGRNPGPNGAYLWAAYGANSYPSGYSSQANYGYPPHYHPPSSHYSADSWMIHGGQNGGPYGFRGGNGNNFYGRSYTNTTDYVGFPSSVGGGGGPMRLSYQHRSLGPYGSGYGAHRGRG